MQICIFWDYISDTCWYPFSVLVKTESCESRFFHHRLSQHLLPRIFHFPQFIYFTQITFIHTQARRSTINQSLRQCPHFQSVWWWDPQDFQCQRTGYTGKFVRTLAQRQWSNLIVCSRRGADNRAQYFYNWMFMVFTVCPPRGDSRTSLWPCMGNASLGRALHLYYRPLERQAVH